MTKEEFLKMVERVLDELTEERKKTSSKIEYYKQVNPNSQELNDLSYQLMVIERKITHLTTRLEMPMYFRIKGMSSVEIAKYKEDLISDIRLKGVNISAEIQQLQEEIKRLEAKHEEILTTFSELDEDKRSEAILQGQSIQQSINSKSLNLENLKKELESAKQEIEKIEKQSVDEIKEKLCAEIQGSYHLSQLFNDLITIPKKTEQEMLESFGVCEKYKDNAEFNIYDIKDAIEKFKDLCDPDIDMSANKINHKSFYFLSYYLKNNGYYIEEFPHILDRPPMDPIRFTINDIRNKAFELQLNIGNTVKYQTRRQIIRNFHFSKKNENIEISDDINILFEKISLRNAKFEDMTADEKLCDICNLIENMLSENKKFDEIDYDKIGLGYIDNEIVKRYRKQIQCFRHASEESLNERKKYSENQKNFLIDYGIVIIKTIHALKY